MGFLVVWSKKKIGDGNIFARTDFWSTLFLKMFPTSKWAKLNGFEQLTSRAFRIRSQILVAMSSFNFTAFFLKLLNCDQVRVKGQNSDFLHIWQARSACRRRAAPAAGAQRLLRAPKARAWRAERRRREDVRSPAGVNSKKKKTGAQRLLQGRSAC